MRDSSDFFKSRRTFLRVGGLTGAAALAAACAPAAAPAPAPAPAAPAAPAQPAAPAAPAPAPAAPAPAATAAPAAPAKPQWEQDWDALIPAAKKEGLLTINWIRSSGGSYQPIGEEFSDKFGVNVEISSENSGSLLVPKLLQEHQAGIYSYDLIFTSIRFAETLLKAGALRPMKGEIFRPDITGDSNWTEGYEFGWVDPGKEYGYGFGMNVPQLFWINTDLVKEGEIKSIYDVINPKWKGKIFFTDPRSGYTSAPATALRLSQGEEILKKVFVDMEPAFSRDNRQITEAMVRGQYAIATGVLIPVLEEFKKEGLGTNLKTIDIPEAASQNMSHQMFSLKGAQHPAAAKLYANWFLSKEGQLSFQNATRENSRRTDVPVADEVSKPKPGRKYTWLSGNHINDDQMGITGQMILKLIQ